MPGRPLAAALFIVSCLAACDGGVAPLPPDGGRGDGGSDGGLDAGAPDAGRDDWAFPEPLAVVEDAEMGAVAVAPGGAVTFVFLRDGLWLWRDPPAGEPTHAVISAARSTDLRLAAAPEGDRALAVWNSGEALLVEDGVPGERFWLYGGAASAGHLGLSWTGEVPLVTAQTSQIDYGGQTVPGRAFAFPVPPDGLSDFPLPEADASVAVEEVPHAMQYYQAANTLLDRGDGRALYFSLRAAPNGDGYARLARWYRLKHTSWAPGAAGRYLVPEAEGTLEVPGASDVNVHWVQVHDLGEARYALTWAEAADSMVFDVFVAGLTLDPSGTPSLTTGPHNVSYTLGATANSDHPVIRPTGDGRYWFAWRETEYGPRVALLAADLSPIAILAPETELHVELAAPVSAQVDGSGDLHLVATFRPADDRVETRYYVLRLADAPPP